MHLEYWRQIPETKKTSGFMFLTCTKATSFTCLLNPTFKPKNQKKLEASPHPSSMVTLRSNGTHFHKHPNQQTHASGRINFLRSCSALMVSSVWWDEPYLAFKILSSPKVNLRQKKTLHIGSRAMIFRGDFTADSGSSSRSSFWDGCSPSFHPQSSLDASCRNLGKSTCTHTYWLNWSFTTSQRIVRL